MGVCVDIGVWTGDLGKERSTHPPPIKKRPLKRAVRILLEGILVPNYDCNTGFMHSFKTLNVLNKRFFKPPL